LLVGVVVVDMAVVVALVDSVQELG